MTEPAAWNENGTCHYNHSLCSLSFGFQVTVFHLHLVSNRWTNDLRVEDLSAAHLMLISCKDLWEMKGQEQPLKGKLKYGGL